MTINGENDNQVQVLNWTGDLELQPLEKPFDDDDYIKDVWSRHPDFLPPVAAPVVGVIAADPGPDEAGDPDHDMPLSDKESDEMSSVTSDSSTSDEASDPDADEAGEPDADEAGDPDADEACDPDADEIGDLPPLRIRSRFRRTPGTWRRG